MQEHSRFMLCRQKLELGLGEHLGVKKLGEGRWMMFQQRRIQNPVKHVDEVFSKSAIEILKEGVKDV